jgi:hypothetical protein
MSASAKFSALASADYVTQHPTSAPSIGNSWVNKKLWFMNHNPVELVPPW